jgi:hypothetical protein
VSVHPASNGTIVLEGSCPDDDAERLLQLLMSTPGAVVDWRLCETAHSAVIQVLLAVRPPLQGPPAGEALARWVAMNLR